MKRHTVCHKNEKIPTEESHFLEISHEFCKIDMSHEETNTEKVQVVENFKLFNTSPFEILDSVGSDEIF